MILKYKESNIPFKYPFTISKGTKTHQHGLLVELEYFGLKGYGEAPAIAYYEVTVEKMISEAEQKRRFIEKFSFTEPERYWHYLHHLMPQNPFLVCALDMAAWDIYGKMKGKQLHELWNLDINKNPISDITIGIDTIDKMVAKMKEQLWPVYKIKLGTQEDVEIIKALRNHTEASFRIDANAAWTAEEAIRKIEVFSTLGVEFIEQPLAKDDWKGMKFLFDRSSLPLMADESCVSEHDVEKCQGYFHGINIKLTKCSGITPALRMITKARELNMKVMMGCMNESTIGSAAIAQMAPLLDYVDNDGTLLQTTQTGRGITFDHGKIVYGEGNGLGIEIAPF